MRRSSSPKPVIFWAKKRMGTIRRLVSLVAVAAVSKADLVSPNSSFGDNNACAEIASAYAKWTANGGKGNFAGIPGQTAYDCLRSMPFRPDLAVKFIDDYMGYLQFHSTIEILKDPPAGYISTSIDLTGGLAKIRNRAASNFYTNQYDFDWDINYLISRANDGHLRVGLCSQAIMHFEHGVPLVSISEDGLQLPELYTFFDAELKLNGIKDVSPVVQINGINAVYYLEANVAVTLGFQDPDARYNRIFPSAQAGFSGRYSGGAWTSYIGLWPGVASQTLQFANGTNLTIETTVTWPSVNGIMNYTDGESLFHAACIPNAQAGFGSFPGSFSTVPTYKLPASGPASYPRPVLRHPDDLIRGYYLNETGAQDVAVLQVPTFNLGNGITAFAQTAIEFVKQAAADSKAKIIIDLSGNGGGDIIQGFNLFRVFYPDQPIYSATRFRATELIDLIGRVFSQAISSNASNVLDPSIIFQNAVTPDQKGNFASWEQLYGPHMIFGANMSSLYANFNFSTVSNKDDPISGYGGIPLDPATQHFKTENIIIMTDGYCASTCIIFVELMKRQGVKSIAFGGRPNYGPMQTVGGIKGGQYWPLSLISQYISNAHGLAVNASITGSPFLTPEQLARFEEIAPPDPKNFPFRFDVFGNAGVNFRNTYREGDDVTPLQFIYEAAECRLFFTAKNYVQPASTWLAATNAMLNNGSCVQGSTNAAGSLTALPISPQASPPQRYPGLYSAASLLLAPLNFAKA